MWWTWLCVLAVVPPSGTASKTKASSPVTPKHAALLGTEKQPDYGALKGAGGGLDVLRATEDEETDKQGIYRPWKTRFDLQPYDFTDPDFLKPENRIGYRHFYAANPDLALVPNSRDREAESTVELMFGLTALGTVVCGVLIVNKLQLLEADNLDAQSYQMLMIRVIAFAAAPWLLLGVWLLTLFGAGLANPMRNPHMLYHWQCSAMAWFLLVAPLVNTAYFTVHALWITKLFFSIDNEPTGSMGRMFDGSKEKQLEENDKLTGILNLVTSITPRYILFFMEAACAVFGYMLITFRWGANSQFCQPEVYWATTAFVATVAIVIIFSGLTFVFSVFISVYSTVPWVQDFFGSFREARLLTKMAKEEEKEAQEAAAWRLQQGAVEEDKEVNEWTDFQQDFEEDRARHAAIMQEHADYVEEHTREKPPKHPREEEDKPLVVWGDDESEEGNKEDSRPVITSSLAALNAQVDSRSGDQRWSSQGFAMPFAQRPNSAPVITTSQLLLVPNGNIPGTASTLYTPPPFTNSV